MNPWEEEWRLDPDDPECVQVMRKGFVDLAMGRFHSDGNTDAEAVERAKLIAAAPDLYRALAKVEEIDLPNNEDREDILSAILEAWPDISQAMKKARGEK